MNKQLDKKIERIEQLKAKELEKIASINKNIEDYDKQLKILNDYKKQQEKIVLMQKELDSKIQEHQV